MSSIFQPFLFQLLLGLRLAVEPPAGTQTMQVSDSASCALTARVESTHSQADPAEERVVHVPAWRRHPVERAGITLTASTLLLARDGGACKRGGGWWGVVGLGLGLGFGFGLRVARALARRHARVRCAAHA